MNLPPQLADPLTRYLDAIAARSGFAPNPEPPPLATPPAELTGIAAILAPFARFVVHRDQQRRGDFYVGRPTLWGNPFRLTNPRDDQQREACVRAYARHFAQRSRRQQLYMLAPIRRVIVSEGGRLVCFCTPRLCHAQVLAAWALGRPIRQEEV